MQQPQPRLAVQGPVQGSLFRLQNERFAVVRWLSVHAGRAGGAAVAARCIYPTQASPYASTAAAPGATSLRVDARRLGQASTGSGPECAVTHAHGKPQQAAETSHNVAVMCFEAFLCRAQKAFAT